MNQLRENTSDSIGIYARRWYDEDPELSQIVAKLQYSSDEIKSKVAMLIIKIIIDKRILSLDYENIDDLLDALYAGYADTRRSRWYDINSTVRTAMQMLHLLHWILKIPINTFVYFLFRRIFGLAQ